MIKKFIHSSQVLNSSLTENLINLNSLADARLSNLQLIKYKSNPSNEHLKEDFKEFGYGETFPWLLDEEGKPINYNEEVDLFRGCKIDIKFFRTKIPRKS